MTQAEYLRRKQAVADQRKALDLEEAEIEDVYKRTNAGFKKGDRVLVIKEGLRNNGQLYTQKIYAYITGSYIINDEVRLQCDRETNGKPGCKMVLYGNETIIKANK